MRSVWRRRKRVGKLRQAMSLSGDSRTYIGVQRNAFGQSIRLFMALRLLGWSGWLANAALWIAPELRA